MPSQTMLSYYQENQFNPVPIALETPQAWASHLAKRRNLYDHHLGIPLGLLAGKSVLEFGCNSGENALVLAHYGAKLTLVEPNDQVLPRLHDLFERYGLRDQIVALHNTTVDEFEGEAEGYDLVIAEGFLFTLDQREAALAKICRFIKPSGMGSISFNDRYGNLMEYLKRALLRRACQLARVDPHSQESLALAEQLFGEDFAKLNASRPFAAFWKDSLVTPFINYQHLWSYEELLPLLEQVGCEARSTSPLWCRAEHFNWYKNTRSPAERHRLWLESWREVLPYILTGLAPKSVPPADNEVTAAVDGFMRSLSDFTDSAYPQVESLVYPPAVDAYLRRCADDRLARFGQDLNTFFVAMGMNDAENLIRIYHTAEMLRGLWGTTYHYLSFSKL